MFKIWATYHLLPKVTYRFSAQFSLTHNCSMVLLENLLCQMSTKLSRNVESNRGNSFTPLSQAMLSLYQFSQELTLAGQHFINNYYTPLHENHT